MADGLDGHGAKEAQEGDRLRQQAVDGSAGVLAASTVAVAAALLRGQQVGDTLEQVEANYRQLRQAASVANSVARDIAKEWERLYQVVSAALWAGFVQGANARASLIQGDGVQVHVHLSDVDRQALVQSYPILGHSVPEAVGHLCSRLRYEVDGCLAMPLSGTFAPQDLPVQMQAVVQAHAVRVGGAVDAAYFAGIQAATKAVAAALTGA